MRGITQITGRTSYQGIQHPFGFNFNWKEELMITIRHEKINTFNGTES